MSVEEMCQGSTIVRQDQTHTVGASGGDAAVPTDGDSFDCNFQEMSGDESQLFDARGERSLFTAFFAEDPGFTVDSRAKLTVRSNVTLATPLLLKVIGTEFESDPEGELKMWIVYLEDVTQRFEV